MPFRHRSLASGQLTTADQLCAYALDMSVACAISYWIMTHSLISIVDRGADLLGGMWAAVATVFVFRETRANAWSAGVARLITTVVSFVLCLLYFWFLPFTIAGMMSVIGFGTPVMILLDRRDDIVTAGITTVVVMVAAAIDPQHAWQQPLLRFIDTIVGIGVGVLCQWAASFLYFRIFGKSVR